MAESGTLRFDDVPLEDFLASLSQHEQDVRLGYLPRAVNLKEVRFTGRLGGPEGPAVRLFLLQETEALSQVTETFLVLAGPSEAAAALRDTGVALRTFLGARKEPSLFRIDPRYGLVCGSALEAVEPSVKWDRPGAYVTIYLTDDPGSPSLAVVEYVTAENQRRYAEIFQRYNGVAPKKPSLFGGALKRLAGAPAPAPGSGRVNYRIVKALTQFLSTRGLAGATVSLIFKDVGPADAASCLLDSRYRNDTPGRTDRFLPSLGELA